MSSDWLETASGNRINRSCAIKGSQNIIIEGSTTIDHDCTIVVEDGGSGTTTQRGSPSKVRPPKLIVGKCTYIAPKVRITLARETGDLRIGSFTMIGAGTRITNCHSIGSRVLIKDHCDIPSNCTIYDCCIIEEGTNLPQGFTALPFTRVTRELEQIELPPGYKRDNEEYVKNALIIG